MLDEVRCDRVNFLIRHPTNLIQSLLPQKAPKVPIMEKETEKELFVVFRLSRLFRVSRRNFVAPWKDNRKP